jgi:hypothetical protein
MGKQSELKKQRLLLKSPADWADFYLNAKDARAKDFRLQVAYECISKLEIGENSIPMVRILQLLPHSFVDSYINLVGHTMVGSRHKDFWPEIAKDLLLITAKKENEIALEKWGVMEKIDAFDSVSAKGWCYATLQQLAEMPQPIRVQGIRADACKNGLENIFVDAIPTHLVVSSCVAKRQVVHQSGSLILCYAKDYTGDKDRELWLVKKRHDGIYTTSAEARDGTLKTSEVRDMRQFVQNYQDLPMQGRLCPAREKEAARICKLVGLHVNGNHAYLRSRDAAARAQAVS